MASKEETKEVKAEEAPAESKDPETLQEEVEEKEQKEDSKEEKKSEETQADATEENQNDPESSDDGKNLRVYVGNLAWEVSWQDLKDLMKSTGHEVTRSDIMQTPDGRSKGCGIVEFATSEGAQEAVLTLNDTELKGRQIFVREDREDRGGFSGKHRFSSGEQAQTRRVYVGNLSWDVAWPELKDHMRTAGEVVHAEVICEHNGRSKGCGIVEYATDEAAQEAIENLTHTELKGRMIFVREDRETSSTGGAPSGGAGAGARGQSTSVYVWNLTYDTTWQELKDHMRKAGNVDQATILTDPEGTSIGCGIVVYQKSHEATRAIRELQDSDLKGRVMHLREDRVQSGRGPQGGRGGGGGRGRAPRQTGGGGDSSGQQLFVSNLSFETTWKELKDHFKQCGEVERADVKFSGGRSRGFGTVLFSKKEEAEAAIEQLNGGELMGREIEVRLDQKA